MFLIDTNVVSEWRQIPRGRADPGVVRWTASRTAAQCFMSVMNVLELERGYLSLSRRDEAQAAVLRHWFDHDLLPCFVGRILPVDHGVALKCASLHVPDPRPETDALIAATALVHGLTVVTRNTRDFAPMGVPTINPWTENG